MNTANAGSIALNNSLFIPSASVHIVLNLLLIVMVNGIWRIVKRGNHICLDIHNLGYCILHTANHILQKCTVKLQELGFHKLIRIVLVSQLSQFYASQITSNNFSYNALLRNILTMLYFLSEFMHSLGSYISHQQIYPTLLF